MDVNFQPLNEGPPFPTFVVAGRELFRRRTISIQNQQNVQGLLFLFHRVGTGTGQTDQTFHAGTGYTSTVNC